MDSIELVWRRLAELGDARASLYQAFYESSPNVGAIREFFENVVFSIHWNCLRRFESALPVFFIAVPQGQTMFQTKQHAAKLFAMPRLEISTGIMHV